MTGRKERGMTRRKEREMTGRKEISMTRRKERGMTGKKETREEGSGTDIHTHCIVLLIAFLFLSVQKAVYIHAKYDNLLC